MSEARQSIVPGASDSSALKGIQPVEVRSSEEITVPVAVRESTSGEHSVDAVALERGIEPIEP